MKTLLLILSLITFNISRSQDSRDIASCCTRENISTEGRCSGTASCTACSSCRYCKHCNSGGTCGVCTTYTAPVKTTKNKSYINYTSPSVYSYGDKLIVSSENLNLRKGAGTEFDVEEKLQKGDVLTFLSYEGEWIEVRTVSSGKKGYVNYKYVVQ